MRDRDDDQPDRADRHADELRAGRAFPEEQPGEQDRDHHLCLEDERRESRGHSEVEREVEQAELPEAHERADRDDRAPRQIGLPDEQRERERDEHEPDGQEEQRRHVVAETLVDHDEVQSPQDRDDEREQAVPSVHSDRIYAAATTVDRTTGRRVACGASGGASCKPGGMPALRFPGALAVVAASFVLVGCGGDDDAKKTPPADASRQALAENRDQLRECLKKNGIDLSAAGSIEQLSSAEQTKVRKLLLGECSKPTEAALEVTDQQRLDYLAASKAFFACLRKNGLDVPDPTAKDAPAQLGDIDPNDPAAKKAVAACQSKLPPELGGPEK